MKAAVEGAVADALDPAVIEELQAQAADAASRAVSDELDALNALDEAPEEVEEETPALHYGSVDEFLRQYLRGASRHRIYGRHRL